jgi:sugar lactone lactonase YvrE
MLAGDVLSLAADGSVGRRNVAGVVACIRPRREGGAVLGIDRGFALEERDGRVNPLEDVWTDKQLRMNEGGCDPDGRFYCGSMAYDKQPGAASLYRLDSDGSVRVVLEGVTVSNGLDWSPDGSLAYYNDTDTHRTDVFDYDKGSGLSGRRLFAKIPGRPDGLTVDAEAGVWVAVSDGGQVRRYTAEGALDAVIELPVTKVTACTFGGSHLDQLFITTSREGVAASAEPQAGSLFRAVPGITGLPVREFGG